MATSDPLSPEDRERLVKIAGLLASDKMGERAAAAAKATAILQRVGMTWEEALSPKPGRQTIVVIPPDTTAPDRKIARLEAALAQSERCRQDLQAALEAERSVFWTDKDGGPWIGS